MQASTLGGFHRLSTGETMRQTAPKKRLRGFGEEIQNAQAKLLLSRGKPVN
jgi:hypothetical protein